MYRGIREGSRSRILRWELFIVALLTTYISRVSASLDVRELETVVYDIDISTAPRVHDEKLFTESSTEARLTLTNKHGQNFVCDIPKMAEVSHSREESSINPKIAAEILAANLKDCIKHRAGWWTYTLCRGQHILQEHGAAKDSDFVSNSLGIFSGKLYLPTHFSRSTKDQLLYLEERYEMGTVCEVLQLEGRKETRRSIVRYTCDSRLHVDESMIWSVEETATCEYLFTVKVGSLCALTQFVVPRDVDRAKPIRCSPLLTADASARIAERKKRIAHNKVLANRRQNELRIAMDNAQLRRWSLERRRLERDGEAFTEKMRILDEDFIDMLRENMKMGVMAKTGEEASGETLEAIESIVDSMDEIRTPEINYPSEVDEDAANVWHFFNDPKWLEDGFPLPLDQVDLLNGYYDIFRSVSELESDRVREAYMILASSTAPGDRLTLTHLFEADQLRNKIWLHYPSWLPAHDHRFSSDKFFSAIKDDEFVNELVAKFRELKLNLLKAGTPRSEVNGSAHLSAYYLAQAYAVAKIYTNVPSSPWPKDPNYGHDLAEIVDKLIAAWEQLDADFLRMNPDKNLEPVNAEVAKRAARAEGDINRYYELMDRDREVYERQRHLWKYYREIELHVDRALRDSYKPFYEELKAELIATRREMLNEGRERGPDVISGMAAAVFKDPVDAKYLLRMLALSGVSSDAIKLKVQFADHHKETPADAKLLSEQMSLTRKQQAILEELIAKELNDAKEQEKGRARASAYEYVYREETNEL